MPDPRRGRVIGQQFLDGNQKIISSSKMRNFPEGQGKREIARRRTPLYVAQAIPKIDAEIAEKGHF